MYAEAEILACITTLGIVITVAFLRKQLARLPNWRFLLAALMLLAAKSIASIIEGFYAPHFFNFLEHFFALASVVVLVVWCWNVLLKKRV